MCLLDEAGARVARNVRMADTNIDVPVSDDRCIEVVANGCPRGMARSRLLMPSSAP